jgi:hypothetical protein
MSNVFENLFESVTGIATSSTPLNWNAEDIFNSHDDFLDPVFREIARDNDNILPLSDVLIAHQGMTVLAGGSLSDGLSLDEREILHGGVRSAGMEVLAFYKSRRFLDRHPFVGKWGIFYLREGLSLIQGEIQRYYNNVPDPLLVALDFLRTHERFHYICDVQSLMFEGVKRRKLYEPVRYAFRRRLSYFVEEALANRQVWDWSKKAVPGIEEFAYDFMKLQPNAYSRFDEERLLLGAEWAGIVVDSMPPSSTYRYDLAHWIENVPKTFLRPTLCPEYVMFRTNLSKWISPVFRLPPVRRVTEGEDVLKLLSGRFSQMKKDWESTKQKLLTDSLMPGLNFKPWRKDGRDCCSVRIDRNFRAHLRHLGAGEWLTYIIGSHKELGHG